MAALCNSLLCSSSSPRPVDGLSGSPVCILKILLLTPCCNSVGMLPAPRRRIRLTLVSSSSALAVSPAASPKGTRADHVLPPWPTPFPSSHLNGHPLRTPHQVRTRSPLLLHTSTILAPVDVKMLSAQDNRSMTSLTLRALKQKFSRLDCHLQETPFAVVEGAKLRPPPRVLRLLI